MNTELNDAFYNYIEKFKDLEIPDKRIEIINSIKELNGVLDGVLEVNNNEISYLKSKEITELKDGQESEDDFLEALLVYIENAKKFVRIIFTR